MDDVTKEVRAVSKALFGSACRLDALAVIGEYFRPFTAEEFAKEAGMGQSAAYQELARLRQVGLLTRSYRREGDRTYLYSRCETGMMVWTFARALRDDLRKHAVKRLSKDVVSELTDMANRLARVVARVDG